VCCQDDQRTRARGTFGRQGDTRLYFDRDTPGRFSLRSCIEESLLKSKSKPTEPVGTTSALRRAFQKLGPGLVTGASDDDPSGIATYSQVGAQFGFGMLWTMLFSYPLMVAIQQISARMGRVTGRGIAGSIRRHYSHPVVYSIVTLLVFANVFNLGADIGAMASAARLIVPGPAPLYVLGFGGLCLCVQVWVPYKAYVKYLKWLTLALLAYVATAFAVRVPWSQALLATVFPSLHFEAGYFTALIAVLGTTISPYLFFWQASQEVEEIGAHELDKPLLQAHGQAREQFDRIGVDTYAGMAISNLVAFFIILTAAVTLHAHGLTDIQTADQAASALRPLAGQFAFLLFAAGIVGTGLLAVPVLAGSAAYGICDALHWKASLEKKPEERQGFYGALALVTAAGVVLNFAGINPIKALFWSAVFNGIAATPVMAIVMLMACNRKLMGPFVLGRTLRWMGWIATAVMCVASLGMFVSLAK
jgi:NRAMP (natural resistance-associated macrophage protein)-like metal ion transporter